MSQQELAAALGLTFQQVQKYEKGSNRIAASRLVDIADALAMPVCDFFVDLSRRPKTASAAHETAELTVLFGRIVDKKTRRRVLDMVRVMADA